MIDRHVLPPDDDRGRLPKLAPIVERFHLQAPTSIIEDHGNLGELCFASVEPLFPSIGRRLARVGDPLSFICYPLALVRQRVAPVGRAIARICRVSLTPTPAMVSRSPVRRRRLLA